MNPQPLRTSRHRKHDHPARPPGRREHGEQKPDDTGGIDQKRCAVDVLDEAEQTIRLPRSAQPIRNHMATIALVLGLVACALSGSPVVGFVAFPLSLAGFVLGRLALRRARMTAAAQRNVARAGLIASVAGFTLAVISALTLLSAADPASPAALPAQGRAAPDTASHTVTYKVTTTDGAKVTVSYAQGAADVVSASDASSPWTQDVTIKGSAAVLTATAVADTQSPDRRSGVTCSIIDSGSGRTIVTDTVPPSADTAVVCNANDLGN